VEAFAGKFNAYLSSCLDSGESVDNKQVGDLLSEVIESHSIPASNGSARDTVPAE
jgi:hypothetical protein